VCGIVGMFAQRGVVSRDALSQATQALVHRGPDGQRRWLSQDQRAGLGHTRLSIIDLEGGSQPLSNEDDQIRLVVNGELYDFERIRRDLEAHGHTLRTRSDSEIAVHLYEDLGTECLRHLRGEFAFILWDGRNEMLFAARDRFGIKPLYYAVHRDVVHLASEIKALFAAGVPARWDRESFFQRTYLPCNPDRTLFEGVYQVPPGCYLLATRGQVRVVRYWDIEYPRDDERTAEVGEPEFVEMFRDKLDESIRIRLRADVPVGVFLSGGIDSSAVLGMAARHAPEPLHAFTVAFDDPEYDEEALARETAELTGARFHPVPVRAENFAAHIADAAWHGETVTTNSNSVARYLMARAVHEAGYKVVLCGEGADEILAGYRALEEEFLPPGERAPDVPHWRATRFNEQLAAVEPILGNVPLFLRDAWFAQRSIRTVLSGDFLNEFSGRNPFLVMLSGLDGLGRLPRWSAAHRSMYLWSKLILSNYILYADRMEMAHGVEVRLPFLDHHLFELVQRMPRSLYRGGPVSKRVLREAAKPYVTETIYRRPKRMFAAPPDTTGRSSMRALTEEVLRSPTIADVPFFDRQAVQKLLDKLPDADRSLSVSLDPLVKLVVSTCLLQRRFKVQSS
jgi:asparagine synthase (glutamine-hydrolysing)